jgi:hypothetical protein
VVTTCAVPVRDAMSAILDQYARKINTV